MREGGRKKKEARNIRNSPVDWIEFKRLNRVRESRMRFPEIEKTNIGKNI